ncbi:putative ABC transport system substrate-binding protein [Rhizobiales bacterium GAS191]|nr:putative ABC transport system substrate-binding protein [Rhizobiales bacterium GAS191]
MRRREFISLLGGAALATPLVARAQLPGKVWQVGYLAESPRSTDDVFRQAMRELGYVEGRNLTIIYRWGESGNYALLAADLVRLNVDLIVAVASPATRAAKDATKTIPIVVTQVGDPVAYGFIASLARPGGNITGMSSQLSEIGPKGLQFIKEIIPTAAKLAIVGDPSNPGTYATVTSVGAAALALGFKTEFYGVVKSDDLNSTFTAILAVRPDALFVIPDPFLRRRRARIIDFALTNRIPAIYGLKEYVADGGLMALGPNRDEMAKRAAVLVDKILKGARPGDLPVEQPTKFELFINLKTAKPIGLAIPQSILARADEVIE